MCWGGNAIENIEDGYSLPHSDYGIGESGALEVRADHARRLDGCRDCQFRPH